MAVTVGNPPTQSEAQERREALRSIPPNPADLRADSGMTREQYRQVRRALRVAMRLDRKAADRWLDDRALGLHRGQGFDFSYHANEVLSGLSPREREAVLATPLLAQFVPRGPKAMRVFTRGGMDLNKRVALRRALRAYEAAFPRVGFAELAK